MGALYLLDLADVCRRTGRPVVEVDGWPHRARGSGGYDDGQPGHVIVHHTASGPNSDGWPDVNYCCYGDEDAPIGNLYLARDGTIYVMAGGAANTNGSGSDPCGIVPDDGMNSRSIAVEAGNDGVGEPWSPAQQDSYVRLVAELLHAYNIGVAQCHSHAEWSPGRKVDPAGASRYATGADIWDMDAFRADVAAVMDGAEPAPTPEEDELKIELWKLPDDPAVYRVDILRGGKLWLPTGDAVARAQELARMNGQDDEIKTQNDRDMFRAYGAILGAAPGGVDEFGIPR